MVVMTTIPANQLHRFTTLTLAVLIALLSPIALNNARSSEKTSVPNIVFILTDDQGYGDLSCHGNPILKTPHLDKLYRESVRLTHFHVDPTCSPSRAALRMRSRWLPTCMPASMLPGARSRLRDMSPSSRAGESDGPCLEGRLQRVICKSNS